MSLLAIVLPALLLQDPAPPKVGDVVPDLAMKTLDGKEIKLSDFRADKEAGREGQIVVIFFQSEKCPVKLPPEEVKKIADRYDEKSGVKFLAVFAYGHDSEAIAKQQQKDHKLTYPCIYDEGRKVTQHLGSRQVNTTYVLDKEGKLVYRGALILKDKEPAVEAVKALQEGKEVPPGEQKFKG